MLIVYGIWARLSRLSGGTSKPYPDFRFNSCLLMLQSVSFLVKDAQQDIAGDRLKA